MPRHIPPFILVLSTLAGCFEGELACTDLAAASVMLTVVSETGEPMTADTVIAVDVEGNDVDATCSNPNASVPCSEWIVGYEVDGLIEIAISVGDPSECEGLYGEGSGSVTVERDECHVIGEALEIEMVVMESDCG